MGGMKLKGYLEIKVEELVEELKKLNFDLNKAEDQYEKGLIYREITGKEKELDMYLRILELV